MLFRIASLKRNMLGRKQQQLQTLVVNQKLVLVIITTSELIKATVLIKEAYTTSCTP